MHAHPSFSTRPRRPATSPRAPRGGRGWRLPAAGALLLLLVVAWFVTRGRGPDLDRVANLEAPGEVVVFFGDSITQGYGVGAEESFPGLVGRELGLVFVNAGVAGDTTAQGLARLEGDVLVHRPRLTVVEFGGNDFLRRVPLEETLRNLDTIVGTLVARESMVVLLQVNVGLMGDPYLKGYRAMAERHGALLVADILRGILASPDLKVDAIHPNAQGHRRIADRVIRVLRPLLREADRRRGAPGGLRSDFPLPALRAVG